MINKGKKMISQVFQEEFGKPYTLKCVIDETLNPVSDSPPKKKETTGAKLNIEHLYKKEPIVKKIIDEFNGEIIQG